jgi:O-acetyl-ADP-ribose deacetylase (regulator of RNase III)
MAPLQVKLVDITTLTVDAIVNAANEALVPGGGVDGAIHDAAGFQLFDACRAIPEVSPGVRCPTGEARATPAFDLPSRTVIHTVAPVWRGGQHGEEALLRQCFRSSFACAAEAGALSIAFPALGCGAFRYPLAAAARIAVDESAAAVQRDPNLRVYLVAIERDVHAAFERALRGRGDAT